MSTRMTIARIVVEMTAAVAVVLWLGVGMRALWAVAVGAALGWELKRLRRRRDVWIAGQRRRDHAYFIRSTSKSVIDRRYTPMIGGRGGVR